MAGKDKGKAIRAYADRLALKALERLEGILEDAGTGNGDVFKAAGLLLERHLKGGDEADAAAADYTIRAEE